MEVVQLFDIVDLVGSGNGCGRSNRFEYKNYGGVQTNGGGNNLLKKFLCGRYNPVAVATGSFTPLGRP